MKALFASAAVAVMIAASPASAATFVVDANSLGTPLGVFLPGQAYKFTTTGVVDLVGDTIPGSFSLNADGIPVVPVTSPGYGYFNPNGSDTANGGNGPAGPGVNFGALIGTFDNINFFKIGTNLTTSFPLGGALFARINDINQNNSGSFTVDVAAVPETATWAMMITGFGLVGGAMRRHRKAATTVSLA